MIGGRIGYVLIYNFKFFQLHPEDILKLWQGGMSFHGAVLGCVLGIYLASGKIPTAKILDQLVLLSPIVIFFGRVCNFLNQELIGRRTSSNWGVVFSRVSLSEKYLPSQLFEAFFEGVCVGVLLIWMRKKLTSKPGALTCLFLCSYSVARFLTEFTRAPDQQIGFLWGFITLGQALSVVTFFVTVILWRKMYAKEWRAEGNVLW